ncbi:MAG: leucine--tRNA ligase [Clostridia bacterium]|nr:leucine--tRNA ligase [Clostridia bacterium]
MEYDYKKIESEVQARWEKEKTFRAIDFDKRKKYFALMEFPGPTAKGVHMGNVRSYIPADINARYHRLLGENVLYPIGYDAFGLPTENFALKEKIHPAIATENNIKNFSHQFSRLGLSFDWDRVVSTTDADYYKWTQFIFLKLFEKGLAYKDYAFVNYCPNCQVVLSNEDCQGGKCDRCGQDVEQKQRNVWFLKITEYAEKMLKLIDEADYSESVKMAQRNWIGKSEGALIDFKLKQADEKFKIFTTRPDTIFGVTFMVLAPENPIIDKYKDKISNFDEVLKYREEIKSITMFERREMQANKEKTGVKLNGLSCVNPLTNEEVPIFIADYVVMGYGTGAIMAVPAHDDRDKEFAIKFGVEIKEVYKEVDGKEVAVNSDFINGLAINEAKEAVIKFVEEKGIGQRKINYKMQEWAFNRQRYWGEPFPIIECSNCGFVPLDLKDLPLTLPDMENIKPSADGDSPLCKCHEWVNVKCPKCGCDAKRETDTMPQWAGSSWYWLRYIDPKNDNALADMDKLKYWGAVDLYTGGSEHVTRHMIYAQFWNLFLYDLGLVPERVPFKKRICCGLLLDSDGKKMSKSKGNSLDPLTVLETYSADTLRMHLAFMGDYEKAVVWSDAGMAGCERFLDKVWKLQEILQDDMQISNNHEVDLNVLIKNTRFMYDNFSHNTVVSELMKFINVIYKDNYITKGELKSFLIILNPIAPHISSYLFNKIYGEKIEDVLFPEYDSTKLERSVINIPIQINGKLKRNIDIDKGISEEDLMAKVKAETNLLDGKEIKKVIFVKDKILNIIVA